MTNSNPETIDTTPFSFTCICCKKTFHTEHTVGELKASYDHHLLPGSPEHSWEDQQAHVCYLCENRLTVVEGTYADEPSPPKEDQASGLKGFMETMKRIVTEQAIKDGYTVESIELAFDVEGPDGGPPTVEQLKDVLRKKGSKPFSDAVDDLLRRTGNKTASELSDTLKREEERASDPLVDEIERLLEGAGHTKGPDCPACAKLHANAAGGAPSGK